MSLSKDCIFCKIITGEIPSKKVFENEAVLAFLDIFPLSQGHTILILKSHETHFEDVSRSGLIEIFSVAQVLGKKYLKIMDIEGFNILINNHPAAGQLVEHFHIHIIPRKTGDGLIKHKIPKEQATFDELDQFLKKLSK